MANPIAALLDALKRKQGGFGLGADDEDEDSALGKPVAAKLSVIHAKPTDDSDPDADSDLDLGGAGDTDADSAPPEASKGGDSAEAAQNAAIVDALQDQYPQIYAKIAKSLDQGDDSASGAPAAPAGGASADDLRRVLG